MRGGDRSYDTHPLRQDFIRSRYQATLQRSDELLRRDIRVAYIQLLQSEHKSHINIPKHPASPSKLWKASCECHHIMVPMPDQHYPKPTTAPCPAIHPISPSSDTPLRSLSPPKICHESWALRLCFPPRSAPPSSGQSVPSLPAMASVHHWDQPVSLVSVLKVVRRCCCCRWLDRRGGACLRKRQHLRK